MPHVDEFIPAPIGLAGLVLAAVLVTGCTETQRKVPLLSSPAVPVLAHARDAATGRRPDAGDATIPRDPLPLATTGASIGAGRRT